MSVPLFSLFEHPLLGRGFRPFFAIGAFYAAFGILLWVLHWTGFYGISPVFEDPVLWHAHEMIFGYTMAIIAGFLLTAVANWTGHKPARQTPLLLLCLIWIIGRIALNIPGLSFWLAACLDLAFIPALAFILALPLLKSWNKRNFIFLFMLGTLFLCNLSLYLWQDRTALYIAVTVVMMMISLIGGRIIPAFTVAALRRKNMDRHITDQPRMDIAALASLAFLVSGITFFGMDHIVTGILAFLAAGLHLWRMRYYHSRDVWQDPLLWSLHLGYGWLVIGLALLGGSAFGFLPLSPALHALTAGAIGTMTLSMMCRVTLGHTGRDLATSPVTLGAFLFMQMAVITRVAGPLLFPQLHTEWIILSSGFWSSAFLLYLFVYLPFLSMKRIDGRPT